MLITRDCVELGHGNKQCFACLSEHGILQNPLLFVTVSDAFLHQIHSATDKLKKMGQQATHIMDTQVLEMISKISSFYLYDLNTAFSKTWVRYLHYLLILIIKKKLSNTLLLVFTQKLFSLSNLPFTVNWNCGLWELDFVLKVYFTKLPLCVWLAFILIKWRMIMFFIAGTRVLGSNVCKHSRAFSTTESIHQHCRWSTSKGC